MTESIQYLIALVMATLAYSCISIGFIMMKSGIVWLGWKGKRDIVFFKKLALWLTGFLIMNIYGVPSAIALKTLPPHVVAAFAGWGIVLLVFLSRLLLKEKLYRSDWLYALLVVIGIVMLNLFEKTVPYQRVNLPGLLGVCAVPVLLFAIALFFSLSSKWKTIFYGTVSGVSAALMVVFLDLLVGKYQYRVTEYLQSPYLYGYLVAAVLSTIALQMALKKGPMMTVGPVQYSSNIVFPVIALFFVYSRVIPPGQFPAIGLIVVAVVNILKKR